MKVVITGGAGFIGSNAASRHLRRGDQVVIVDDLSRIGADSNLAWLRSQGCFEFARLDLRNADGVKSLVHQHKDAALVLHLAGQVTVTKSVEDPRTDFESNALGTLNVLEALRICGSEAVLLYASTNKVYGSLDHVRIIEHEGRYAFENAHEGVGEDQPLDFHSPYGCSKGAADQYVRDYHRIYGLRTVVFRQSCIYGYRQFGIEDQGWVAWFAIAAQRNLPLRIYGDGKQVRDILFVDDLLDAFDAAYARIDRVGGRVYNIGGGSDNAISLRDLIEYLEVRLGRRLKRSHLPWRPGDQKIYISDIRRSATELEWVPRRSWRDGLGLLCDWVSANEAVLV